MKLTPNLVVGVAITIVGIVLLFDRVGLMEMRQVLHLWPILLTLFGLSVVVQALKGEPNGSPGAVGRPIVGPGFVLFLVVVSVIAVRTDGRRFFPSGTPADSDLSLVAIMGRDERVSLSPAFRRAGMTSVMGRTQLDLRKATLAPGGEAVIDIFGMMGAVEVFVPAGWTVDVQAHTIMGGTQDRRRPQEGPEPSAVASKGAPGAPPSTEAASAPTATRLVIRGLILMGGLVIRS